MAKTDMKCAACKKETVTKQFIRWRNRRWCFDCCSKLGEQHGYKTLRRYLHRAFEKQGIPIPKPKPKPTVIDDEKIPQFKVGDWVSCHDTEDIRLAEKYDDPPKQWGVGDIGQVFRVEQLENQAPWYDVIITEMSDYKSWSRKGGVERHKKPIPQTHGRCLKEDEMKPARKPKGGLNATISKGVRK